MMSPAPSASEKYMQRGSLECLRTQKMLGRYSNNLSNLCWQINKKIRLGRPWPLVFLCVEKQPESKTVMRFQPQSVAQGE